MLLRFDEVIYEKEISVRHNLTGRNVSKQSAANL